MVAASGLGVHARQGVTMAEALGFFVNGGSPSRSDGGVTSFTSPLPAGYGARLKDACALVDLRLVELEALAISSVEREGVDVGALGCDRSLVFAVAYARVLGVSLDWLVLGQGADPYADEVTRAVAEARRATGAA